MVRRRLDWRIKGSESAPWGIVSLGQNGERIVEGRPETRALGIPNKLTVTK